jgi:thioredoxin reductase
MKGNSDFEGIIIGGSYAGLSAAMSLGRSLRKVLVIDSGQPCNRQTPHSHNFLTRDGQIPGEIARVGKEQVLKYETVHFLDGFAASAQKNENGFELTTGSGDLFTAGKLIFATGLKDKLPDFEGYAACWGISILHCPYCHGYEVRNEKTGIIGNGATGFEFARMISNWTEDLTIFTDGEATFSSEESEKLKQHNIRIIETEIDMIEQESGRIQNLVLKDGTKAALKAMYARPAFVQHSDIPAKLGCELTEHGLLKVDASQRTTVPGIYAAGDNSNFARSVAVSVSAGSMTGAMLNRRLIEEGF